MKLYLMFGIVEKDGEEFKYFYGVFSSEEKANEIKKSLEENPNGDENESFAVEEHVLDEPDELYYFMLQD